MRTWFKFYKDLFEREPPNNILLALNRIMKKNVLKGTLRTIAKNSFRIVTKSLKQSIPGEKIDLNFEDTNITKSFDLKGREIF